MQTTGKYAIFTIDLEDFADTGCIRRSGETVDSTMLDGFDEYMELLGRYGIRATVFALCSTAVRIKDRLKKYIDAGHEIALHGFDHTAPSTIDDSHFREYTAKAKSTLEKELGITVHGYRAPFFSLDSGKLEILRDLGLEYDSSFMEFSARDYSTKLNFDTFGRIGKYVFSKEGFFEFGIPCQKVLGFNMPVSGGGYARLAVWSFFRNVFEKYIKGNNYYTFYLHPFELSNEEIPRINNLPAHDRYYLKHGFDTYRKKIEIMITLLKEAGYSFVTFEQYARVVRG